MNTDSGLQQHIDTQVRGETLKIDQNYSITGRSPDVAVAVTLPRLAELDLSGSASTTIGGIRGESLHVSSSGSGDTRTGAEVKTLAVDAAGSGDIALAGTAGSAHVTISGSGTVTGSGDITYYGDPAVSSDVAGSGSVQRAGA